MGPVDNGRRRVRVHVTFRKASGPSAHTYTKLRRIEHDSDEDIGFHMNAHRNDRGVIAERQRNPPPKLSCFVPTIARGFAGHRNRN